MDKTQIITSYYVFTNILQTNLGVFLKFVFILKNVCIKKYVYLYQYI